MQSRVSSKTANEVTCLNGERRGPDVQRTPHFFAGPRNSPWPGVFIVSILLLAPLGTASALGFGGVPGAHPSPLGLGAVIENITAGKGPVSIAYDGANQDLYVSNELGTNLTVISATSNTVTASVQLPYPTGSSQPGHSVVDSANGNIYTTIVGAGVISVISGSTNTNVTMFPVIPQTATSPDPLAVDTATGDIWVGEVDVGNVTSYNPSSGARTGTPLTDPTGSYTPTALCFDSANGDMYIPEGSTLGSSVAGRIAVVDGTTDALVTTFPTSATPGTGCAVDATNGDIYVPGGTSSSVYVINGATNALTPAIVTGGATPFAVAFDNQNGYLYIANLDGKNITVINGANNQVAGAVPVGPSGPRSNYPEDITFDGSNGYVYVALHGCAPCTYGWVSVLNPSASSSSGSLTSVAISGILTDLATGASVTLTAVPTCSGGSCPSGVSYSWTLLGTPLGTLSSTTSSTVTFTAGGVSGDQSIAVTAKLNGNSQSAGGLIVIGAGGSGSLTSVSIAGIPSSLAPNASATLSASPTCSAGGCPSGITYHWELLGTPLGSLSATTGPSVTFTAGATQGSQEVQLSAFHNGTWKNTTGLIVVSPNGGGGSPPGNGWLLWVVIIGVIAAAAVVGVVVMMKMRARPPSRAAPPPQYGSPPPQYGNPPPHP